MTNYTPCFQFISLVIGFDVQDYCHLLRVAIFLKDVWESEIAATPMALCFLLVW